MSSLLSSILHPLVQLKFATNDDSDDDPDRVGIDPLYPLTVCFAVGIYLVFQRYQTVRYRAVPFVVPVPPVSGVQHLLPGSSKFDMVVVSKPPLHGLARSSTRRLWSHISRTLPWCLIPARHPPQRMWPVKNT